MSKKPTIDKFDCVEMKRHIQEKIYEETRSMKPEEFLAYIHQQVQESRFAALFFAPEAMAPTSSRAFFQPVVTPAQVGEAEAKYDVNTD